MQHLIIVTDEQEAEDPTDPGQRDSGEICLDDDTALDGLGGNTALDWPPEPPPPGTPAGRRAGIFRAVTDSKLKN